jgi:hypothetical protein
MKKLISLLICCIVSFCPLAFAAPAAKADKPVASTEVVSAEFGIFTTDKSGQQSFVPSTVVPLVPGQAYGWVMRVQTNKPTIKWREEFLLPKQPATWGEPDPTGAQSVTTDGLISITEREVAPDHGLIYNSWAVAAGDPKGEYVLLVFVEDTLVKVFKFNVQ